MKSKNTVIYLLIVLATSLLSMAFAYWFRDNFKFQAPMVINIKFQKLIVPVGKEKTISPISLGVKRVYAAELPKIDPATVDMFDQEQVKAYVRQEAIAKFGADEWDSLNALLMGEGNYQSYVFNHEGSGACGIFQFLPCSKLGARGLDLANQTEKGLAYVEARYGTPTKAYIFWLKQSPHWY